MRERIGQVTVTLFLKQTPLRNGLYPAYIRVQYKAQNRYYTAHGEFTRKEWQRFEKAPEFDHPVMLVYAATKKAVNTLVRSEDFSFQALSRLMLRSPEASIQQLVLDYVDDLKKKRAYGTAGVYTLVHNSLDDFLKGKPVPVNHFDARRCQEFIDWLSEVPKNNPTTISMKARALTAVFQKAVKEHIVPLNPMKDVKKPSALRRNMDISSTTLEKLLNVPEQQIGSENFRYLQYWRACYYGNGMNVNDLLRLRYSDIRGDEIIFIRHKTQFSSARNIHVPLTAEFHAALGALSGGREHIIPELDAYEAGSEKEHLRIKQVIKNINKHLRDIRSILSIPEKITTQTARHTFATRLQRAGVPVEFISDAMGHSRITTTQNYLEGYTPEWRKEKAKILKI